MIGLRDNIVKTAVFLSIIIYFGCKTDDINEDSNSPNIQRADQLRQDVINEETFASARQYNRFCKVEYSGSDGTNKVVVSLKQIKGDTLIIYSLSKEEFYKYQYLAGKDEEDIKSVYHYPFGIRKYISKADYSVGSKLFNIVDSIIVINQKLKEEANEEISETDRFKLQYWNGHKFFEMKLNYLNEKSFDFIFLQLPILFENDSSALRLMREPIDGTNN